MRRAVMALGEIPKVASRRFDFPAGESGIEEDIRRAIGDKCDVTATTAAQNGYL